MSRDVERWRGDKPARSSKGISKTTLGVGVAIGLGAALVLNFVVSLIVGLVKLAIVGTIVIALAYLIIVGPPSWKDKK